MEHGAGENFKREHGARKKSWSKRKNEKKIARKMKKKKQRTKH